MKCIEKCIAIDRIQKEATVTGLLSQLAFDELDRGVEIIDSSCLTVSVDLELFCKASN